MMDDFDISSFLAGDTSSNDEVDAIFSSPSRSPFDSPSLSPQHCSFGSDLNFDGSDSSFFAISSTPCIPDSWLAESLAMGHLAAKEPPPVTIPPQPQPVIQTTTKPKAVHHIEPPKPARSTKRRKVETNSSVSSVGTAEEVEIPAFLTPAFEAADKGEIILSKDELLNLTSTQHEELLARVRHKRDLTVVEKQNVKRQRRLIKNRESAQASRQRKKSYVEELEKKVADLMSENTRLSQSVNTLTSENMFLRTQVEALKPVPMNSGMNSLFGPPLFPNLKNNQHFGNISPMNMASGVVLMVLLFSFAIVFGNFGLLAKDNIIFDSVKDMPLTGRIFESPEFQPLSSSQGFETLTDANRDLPFVGRLREKLSANRKLLPGKIPHQTTTTATTKAPTIPKPSPATTIPQPVPVTVIPPPQQTKVVLSPQKYVSEIPPPKYVDLTGHKVVQSYQSKQNVTVGNDRASK